MYKPGRRVSGLPLESITGIADAQAARNQPADTVRLLNYMRELMCDQLPACNRMRRILAGVEHYVVPHGVGYSVDRPRRLSRPLVRVHSDVAEVVAETSFHEGACGGIERLAA